MTTEERIIPAKIHDDGSVHYSSVMSPSDDSVAVCAMVPDRFIPVIFVPGVMGTNLKSTKNDAPVWLVNSPGGVAIDWAGRGATKRKQLLDPKATDVYTRGQLPTGTSLSKDELYRRGWGEVAFMSYGTFLPWLERALSDANTCGDGWRAKLLKDISKDSPQLQPLTHAEVASSYKYQFPVHAVGYNWLQSNAQSAKRLSMKIDSFMEYYRSTGRMCERVILVTHSMGGLVSRYYSQCIGGAKTILGVVHGVMPATGSATAYKRVKAGSEMPTGFVLGADAAQMTAVFAQSPGPLQLLPSPEYGMNWLQIRDGKEVVSKPAFDPYSEIYTARGEWWSLCDDKLINPVDTAKGAIDADWSSFERLINEDVLNFHLALSGKDKTGVFHENTYAFYGDDKAHSTWGDVVWERVRTPALPIQSAVDNMAVGVVQQDKGTGSQALLQKSGGLPLATYFSLRPAAENGDGTVPIRSGRIAQKKVKTCIAYSGVDHEGAYKNQPQWLFALWAITKIAFDVRDTPMAYKV